MVVWKKEHLRSCSHLLLKLGYDFNKGLDYHKLFQSFRVTGFQATSFGQAVEEINKMVNFYCPTFIPQYSKMGFDSKIAKRCETLPKDKEDEIRPDSDEFTLLKNNCTIFLGYTSNMVSCGVRETIRFLVWCNIKWSVEN